MHKNSTLVVVSHSGDEVGEERPDATVDLIADRADGIDALTGGILEIPIEVSLAGVVGASVAAAHGDDDIGCPHSSVIEALGVRAIRVKVDAEFGHRIDHRRIDRVGRGTPRVSTLIASVQEPPKASPPSSFTEEIRVIRGHRAASVRCRQLNRAGQ